MNTRIQVEHAVTEAVCGIDLVALQLRVAAGEALGIEQEQIRLQGHAFEFRIYAEDPRAEFKPTNGKLLYICRAAGAGVREDSWVEAGSVVSSYYDSLLSKLTVWGSSREEAIERSRAALSEYLIEGVETTLDFHRWIVEQEDFKSAAIDVNWIARNYRGQTQPAIVTGPFNLPPLKPGGKS